MRLQIMLITLEERVTQTRIQEQIQITTHTIRVDHLEMKILRQTEVQIRLAEAVHHNHLLQIHQQEAIQEEINKNILV